MPTHRSAVLLTILLAATSSNGCIDSPRDEAGDGSAFDATGQPKDDGAARDGAAAEEPAIEATSDQRAPDAQTNDVTGDPPLDVLEPDAQPDAPFGRDVDGATCVIEPVWSVDCASLRMTTSGGLPSPRGCRWNAPEIYEFFPQTRTLTRLGCVFLGRTVYQVVHLTAAENSRLMAAVAAARTTCQRREPVIDAPTLRITVADGNGCVRRAYDGYQLDGAAFSFQAVADAACNPDGGAPDVGTCDMSDGGSTLVCRSETPSRDVVTDAPVDSPSSDDDLDAGTDGGDGPVCSPKSLWSDRSASFTLRRAGGLPPPGPIDAGCGVQPWYYEFSLPLRTLIEWGCINGQNGWRELALNEEQISTVVAAVKGIQGTCQGMCRADAPDISIQVRDCADFTTTLENNADMSCSGNMARPHLDFNDFFALQNLFGDMIAAGCDGVDAGAGTCGPVCLQ